MITKQKYSIETVLIGALFGFILGVLFCFLVAGINYLEKKRPQGISDRQPVATIVMPIKPSDYIDLELDPIGSKELSADDTTPLYLMKALVNNPIFIRYQSNENVRKVINAAKADEVIQFGEYMDIRSAIRKEYRLSRNKDDQALLKELSNNL